MGLTDDQRAMLRLLARREEGYEDIAALMGLSVEEVRARVKEALAGLDEEAAAPASRPTPPPAEPAPPPPPVPAPEPAQPAPTPAAARPATPPPAPAAKGGGKPKLPFRLPANRRRLAELLGGGLVVLLIVLFATGTLNIGGGDDSGDGDRAANTNGGPAPTLAELSAVDGSDAEGQAVFGRVGREVALYFAAEGLSQTPKGRSYAISLVRSPQERVPIAAVRVGQTGKVAEQFQVADTTLGLLAGGFDEMEVSLVDNAALRRSLQKGQKDEAAPQFDSTDVMRGEVTGPIVEAAAQAEAEAK